MSHAFCQHLVERAVKYGWIKRPERVPDLDKLVKDKARACTLRSMRRLRESRKKSFPITADAIPHCYDP